MTSAANQAAATGEVAFERPGSDTLAIRFSGQWVLRSKRASPDAVQHEIEAQPLRQVTFDSSGLQAWDTAFLTFLGTVLEQCKARGVEADRSGLPAGVLRLLGLAEAVPERAGARRVDAPASWLSRVGTSALEVRDGLVESVAFLGQMTLAFLKLLRLQARFQMSDLFTLIQQAGAEALPIVSLISFLIGLILAFMGAVQLERFGASIYVADLVGLAMAREMGAVMTAIVMAGRTGAAFAAQLGTMKVTEEIDALTTFGLSPMEFLVLPRMLALCVMMPLLCLYADFLGVLGGLVVGRGMLHLSVVQYVNETIAAVTLMDFGLGIFKSAVFGVLIALAGCMRGMQCGNSASAVGDAATAAVVLGIVLIIVTDGLFAVVCNIVGI